MAKAGNTPQLINPKSVSDMSAEELWLRYGKLIVSALILVVVAVGGYFVYQYQFRAPEEAKAAEAMWKAEEYFRQDSASLALNGDAANAGFLKIISRHGNTKAGKLAKFYAASAYMQLGDFNNAIKYLKDFSTSDKMISVRAAGLLGDAYAETGKTEEAVQQYRKAGTMYAEDAQNSSEYLFRAGLLYQTLGKNKEAVEMFTIIKDKYASTERGVEIDKYLARLGSVQ